MCGNFGILIYNNDSKCPSSTATSSVVYDHSNLNDPISIMESQTSATEVRGGQAGGISCIEYESNDKSFLKPNITRVRVVARKRIPLANDLVTLFRKKANKTPAITSNVSFIGHTRFATSSTNIVSELHPHEWVPFHTESVWLFNESKGDFEQIQDFLVGIHLSHNGDFDAISAYSQINFVDNVGYWLENVLNCPNSTKGDSPKVCGCMDLLRVQGRWCAAIRLAYIRSICTSMNDANTTTTGKLCLDNVVGGDKDLLPSNNSNSNSRKTKATSNNNFPSTEYFKLWEDFFNKHWISHRNSVMKVFKTHDGKNKYCINIRAEKLLVQSIYKSIKEQQQGKGSICIPKFDLSVVTQGQLFTFVHMSVRGFLRSDLYNALTEFLVRAEGSFGLQVHCTLEPGVLVIASQGQPMSVAFTDDSPMVLTASEANAIEVPVTKCGKPLTNRIDLDSRGEILRLGAPRTLVEWGFKPDSGGVSTKTNSNPLLEQKFLAFNLDPNADDIASHIALLATEVDEYIRNFEQVGMLLSSGIELRMYTFDGAFESSKNDMVKRIIPIKRASLKYDPSIDLVKEDLKDVPRVMKAIELAWNDSGSPERVAALAFCECLVESKLSRLENGKDHFDLLIGGVEASLWVAEQFATDLRLIYPTMSICTVSANKLLGVGGHITGSIIDSLLPTQINSNTCVLLISQSGQTFPTLHATRKLANLVNDKLWILTGCEHSKMELALKETLQKKDMKYEFNRVLNNYSGNRPAEPTSVAIAATMYTLTHLLLTIHRYVLESESDIKINIDLDEVNNMKNMTLLVVPNLSEIVGYDEYGQIVAVDKCPAHDQLVAQGKRWALHVTEPWNMMVAAGSYIILSITLGLPPIAFIVCVIIRITKAAGWSISDHLLVYDFSVLSPELWFKQPWWWTLITCIIQLLDAIWYVFLIKCFTFLLRAIQGRPLFARHGKRTLVIIDTSCIHQLIEIFVSKLFSQSYGFASIDVHGANGFDHFVHRYTHRVTRGLLLAVGRPDGRVSCLTKSESAMILAVKQAAFIQNTSYPGLGQGVDVVTVGHNPFEPNLPFSHHVVLSKSRKMFIDEVLYDHLYTEEKPSSKSIIDTIERDPHSSQKYNGADLVRRTSTILNLNRSLSSCNTMFSSVDSVTNENDVVDVVNTKAVAVVVLNENKLGNSANIFANLVTTLVEKNKLVKENKTKLSSQIKLNKSIPKSDNSAIREAFVSRLDESCKDIIDSQVYIQLFYEYRIASLERYLGFCVMFHTMADQSCKPCLLPSWDIARSQSNLRVATTACPVSAPSVENALYFFKKKNAIDKISMLFRKISTNF